MNNTKDTSHIFGGINETNYSVTYNLNGGSISNQVTTYSVEDSFTLPISSKTGHTRVIYNLFGSTISISNTNAGALGYDHSFYYISSYSPWTTWTQPDYAVRFTINISEHNCYASFGNAGSNNATYQLKSAGYDFCTVNLGWGAIECTGNYSKVMGLYNNAWNILPRSGYSIYKQISCDSGWSTYARR